MCLPGESSSMFSFSVFKSQRLKRSARSSWTAPIPIMYTLIELFICSDWPIKTVFSCVCYKYLRSGHALHYHCFRIRNGAPVKEYNESFANALPTCRVQNSMRNKEWYFIMRRKNQWNSKISMWMFWFHITWFAREYIYKPTGVTWITLIKDIQYICI